MTRGDAKLDYRRFARACERIIPTPVISRHRDDGPARGRLSPFQSKRVGSRHLLSYASANRRGARVTYPAVCSKGVTLLGNADRADRKPQCARNRTSGWNVRWPAIRAWGQDHSRILDRWAANTGRLEGATAEKAVPFPSDCPSIPTSSCVRYALQRPAGLCAVRSQRELSRQGEKVRSPCSRRKIPSA